MDLLKSLKAQVGWLLVQEWEERNKADSYRALATWRCLKFILEECGESKEFKCWGMYVSDMVRFRFWEGPSGHTVGNELA